MNGTGDSFPDVRGVVACPICKSNLEFGVDAIKCQACQRVYPQPDAGWIDLLPEDHALRDEGWSDRQHEMEGWYRQLVASPGNAGHCLANDYSPYATLLADLSGPVLDVGGGCGIPRHFLSAGTPYVVVEPSLGWLDGDWRRLAGTFPCLETMPTFVRGVGEHLPFAAETFDAVLLFWALNHVRQPDAVLREAARVLSPGGSLIVVLEDMLPRFSDLFDSTFPAEDVFTNVFDPNETLRPRYPRLQLLFRRLNSKQWPLQTDHICIRETDVYRWTARDLVVSRRFWVMHFLTIVFEKHAVVTAPQRQ